MDPSGAQLGQIAGASAIALLALLGPGLAVGRSWLGLRRLTLLAAALPLTAGMVGVLSLLVPLTPLPWVPTVAAVLLAVSAVAVLTAPRAHRRPEIPDDDAGRADRVTTALALVGALLVLVLVTAAGLEGLGIGQPIEHRDAIFHYTATSLVLAGDGSPFPLGGLDALFPGSSGVYYPSLWHGLAAIPSAVSDAVVGSHVTLALVAWTFYVTVAALARTAAPGRAHAPAFAVLAALAGTAFPYYALHFHGQWPWGLSAVLALGALVLGVRLARSPRDARPWVGGLVAVLGAVLAHGSALAVVGVGAVAWASSALLDAGRGASAVRRAGAVLAAVALPLLVAALVVLATRVVPLLGSMADFERPSVPRSAELLGTVLFRVPVPPLIGPQPAAWVLTALAAVGAVVLARHLWGRWLLFTAAALVVLRLAAAGPDGPLRDLTAVWYKDYDRLQAMLVAPMAVIAGVGAAAVVALVARLVARLVPGRPAAAESEHPDGGARRAAVEPARRTAAEPARHAAAEPARHAAAEPARHAGSGRRAAPVPTSLLPAVASGVVGLALAAGIVVSTGGLRLDIAAETVRQGPRQAVPDRPEILTTDEAAWLRTLAGTLPDDAVVLGSPASGAVLAPALTGWTVLPRPLFPPADDPADQLLDELEALGADPAVCEGLAGLGVTHLYLDGPHHMILGWSYPDPAAIPDGTTTVVSSHGEAVLLEITAC